MKLPEPKLPDEPYKRTEEGGYDLTERPWADPQLLSANKIWNKGRDSNFIPDEHNLHWVEESDMESMKGHVDHNTGNVAFKTKPGPTTQWSAGYMDSYRPRLHKTVFADRYRNKHSSRSSILY